MTRTLLIITAVAISSTLLTTNAKADHRSFCFVGQTCGFEGESHMIEALTYLEDAYVSRCSIARRRAVSAARIEVLTAMRTACNSTTKYEMLNAYRDLTRFLLTNDNCYLDTAAAQITTAIELSQAFHLDAHGHDLHDVHDHARPVIIQQRPVIHTTRRVVVPVHHRHIHTIDRHHHHGHRGSYGRSGGSISIGGGSSRVSFRIGF